MSDRKRKWDMEGSGSPATKPRMDSPSAPGASNADDAGAAAAAIAARIAAQYGESGSGPRGGSAARTEGPKYEKDKPELNDPEFVKDIDINDQRNRYLLTKGPTQIEIHQETGCSVTTKGQWYPDRTKATDRDPPLYLHLTATSQEILDKGIAKVQELIDQDLGPLTEQRRDRREPRERVKWPEHKIDIGLENLRNFNVRAKVVGPGGVFVKHIQTETGSRVQIKGLGSGFYETDTGAEAPEPMHINITGPDDKQNLRAKELAEDLLAVVKEKWQEAKAVTEQAQAQYNAPQAQPYNQPMYMGFGAGQAGYAGYPGYGAAAPPPPSGSAPPPPPSGDAPPLPPGEAPPPAPPATSQPPLPGGATPTAPGQPDYSAYYAQYYGQQQAQTLTPEQQAYYNSPEYKAWYQQYLEQYQAQQAAGASPATANANSVVHAQGQSQAGTGPSAPQPPTQAAPPPPPPPS